MQQHVWHFYKSTEGSNLSSHAYIVSIFIDHDILQSVKIMILSFIRSALSITQSFYTPKYFIVRMHHVLLYVYIHQLMNISVSFHFWLL